MSTVVIADDHAVVRMAVRMMLENAGHEVIGEASTGADVVSLVKKTSPQLVILDIDLPQLDGFEVLKRLCHIGGGVKVIVFSGMSADQHAVRCSRAGASAFISKEGDIAELLSAVQIVLAGYTLFPSAQSFQEVSHGPGSEELVIKSLSERELSVLRLLARGYRVRDIANEFLLSQKTVSTYKVRLESKLGVNNMAELIDIAKRNGVT
jgi:two-component system response regulator EvgA